MDLYYEEPLLSHLSFLASLLTVNQNLKFVLKYFQVLVLSSRRCCSQAQLNHRIRP